MVWKPTDAEKKSRLTEKMKASHHAWAVEHGNCNKDLPAIKYCEICLNFNFKLILNAIFVWRNDHSFARSKNQDSEIEK